MKTPNVWLFAIVGFQMVIGVSCTTTSEYVFSDEDSRRCFVPCKSFYSSCKHKCSLFGLGGTYITSTVAAISCSIECDSSLNTCAESCGGVYMSKGEIEKEKKSRMQFMKRESELRDKVRKIRIEEMSNQDWANLESLCSELYQGILLRIKEEPRLNGQYCPLDKEFNRYCRELRKDVVECLNHKMRRSIGDNCNEKMRMEHPKYVLQMNNVLYQCFETKMKHISRSTTSKQTIKQEEDVENPK